MRFAFKSRAPFLRVYTVSYTSAGGKVIFPPTRTATRPSATDGGAQQDRTTKRIPFSLADSLDFFFFFFFCGDSPFHQDPALLAYWN